MKNHIEYGAFLIKPDAVIDEITPEVINRIVDAGFEIEDVRICDRITSEQIDTIWTKNKGREEVFKSLNYNFTRGPAVAVIVSQNGIKKQFPDETVHDSVVRVKGKPGVSGLRNDLGSKSEEQWRAEGYTGDELLYRTGWTRVHGADSEKEFGYMAEALYTREDLDRVRGENPPLFKELKKYVK